MTDIFDNPILCKHCNKKMQQKLISKNGFNLRALECPECGDLLIHPVDRQEYENFMRLKKKEFAVKMRMVGNSYAISIPREIVDFMKEQEKMLNDMVKLSFQNANSLSLNFDCQNDDCDQEDNQTRSRVIKAREYKVVKNNKPVLHVKEFRDSANPKNNKKQIIKSEDNE